MWFHLSSITDWSRSNKLVAANIPMKQHEAKYSNKLCMLPISYVTALYKSTKYAVDVHTRCYDVHHEKKDKCTLLEVVLFMHCRLKASCYYIQ